MRLSAADSSCYLPDASWGIPAVAATAGASLDAAYSGGVAVFTMARGGLMYEATVGGQKFDFARE